MLFNTNKQNLIREAVITASLLCFLAFFSSATFAKGVYLTTTEFIETSFSNAKPSIKTLWLDKELKKQAATILGRPVNAFRVRYWQHEQSTAWILEEIGKELPITIGIVINNNQVSDVKILTYRESRGGEVRYTTFLQQFFGGYLKPKQKLDRNIDGITGATLSVKAVTNTVRLALFYHQLATLPRE